MEIKTKEDAQIIADAYLNARTHLINAVHEMRSMIEEVAKINPESSNYYTPFNERSISILRNISDKDLNEYLQNHCIRCWHMLINQTGLTDMMTREDRTRYENYITEGHLGHLTAENILEAVQNLKKNQIISMKHMVEDVFRFFSPHYASRASIPAKVIKNCSSYGRISFSDNNRWNYLEKSLWFLDNKDMPQDYKESLIHQMSEACDYGNSFECPYFNAKFYHKSGTVHLTFKRMDLIEKINEVGREIL